MYKVALFDLDGTLTESGIGITRSVAYSLRKFGMEETDQAKLDLFIGPPLIDSYMRYYGFTREQAVQAVAWYREYYAETGIFENRVYDGVETMLRTLRNRGVTCVLATSKPEYYAVQILDYFGLSPYFSVVAGATMDETRTGKAAVIAYALSQLPDHGPAIMVGDKRHDIQGAKANGLPAVGVLYGYGSRQELEAAGADHLAQTPMDILEWI